MRRLDLIVIDKKEQKGIIIDIAVPADLRIEEKEKEKVEKYQDLKKEIRRLWKLRNAETVPVVIRALGKECFVGNCKNTDNNNNNNNNKNKNNNNNSFNISSGRNYTISNQNNESNSNSNHRISSNNYNSTIALVKILTNYQI